MAVSNQKKGLVCICGANDSALLSDACCHGNNCLQIIYVVTQMSKVCEPFINIYFLSPNGWYRKNHKF